MQTVIWQGLKTNVHHQPPLYMLGPAVLHCSQCFCFLNYCMRVIEATCYVDTIHMLLRWADL